MKKISLSVLCIVVSFSSLVLANGVSSIQNKQVAIWETSFQPARSTYQLITSVIRSYVRKNWVRKLEKVHEKLTPTKISLAPEKFRPVLVQIKEIIEDEYNLWQERIQYEDREFEPLPTQEVLVKKPDQMAPQVSQNSWTTTSIDVLKIQSPIDWPTLFNETYQLDAGTIDVAILQTTWLWRVNALRKERWRRSIRLSEPLHATATERSELLSAKWTADHRRTPSSLYYNYWELVEWFEQRDIVFTNVNRVTFTENIWYARFICDSGDCTQSAISSMRKIFDYFVSEEWTVNDAHRRTLMQPYFKIMWMWIAVDEATNRIYVTQHYWTALE